MCRANDDGRNARGRESASRRTVMMRPKKPIASRASWPWSTAHRPSSPTDFSRPGSRRGSACDVWRSTSSFCSNSRKCGGSPVWRTSLSRAPKPSKRISNIQAGPIPGDSAADQSTANVPFSESGRILISASTSVIAANDQSPPRCRRQSSASPSSLSTVILGLIAICYQANRRPKPQSEDVMHHNDPLLQILILLAASVCVVAGVRKLKMPAILGYLAVGMLLGPHAFALAVDNETTRLLAEFGVVFLVFTLGLE